MAKLLLILLFSGSLTALAEPLAAPGDLRLRHDLQLLNDSGVIDVPLAAWPLALGDIFGALEDADTTAVTGPQRAAFERVREYLSWELETDILTFRTGLAAAENPRVVRGFERTPREQGEVSAGVSWLGERFTVNLAASYVGDPLDGRSFRPDGSYVGVALGNWMVTAGWQERWWGHGRDGSMILSTNARPMPGVMIQRNRSTPFESKWLRWIGPWTFTSFMTELDDDRAVKNALLFGIRGSFRPPHTGLEIGIIRAAQWCGDGRPCDLDTFGKLLLGKDNRGVNVDPVNEPGNQLAGYDGRWTLPKQVPVALYMQWIGEDGRAGNGFIGSWIRQFGLEHWGTIGSLSHRTHIEVSDSLCREGGFGFSDKKPDCAYRHPVYESGYRYRGKVLGLSAGGDSLSYSIGSTLVQSGGHLWNIALRHMQINRQGLPDFSHSLSTTPQELSDVQVSHERLTAYGRFYAGLGYRRLEDQATASSESDVAAFVQWSSN